MDPIRKAAGQDASRLAEILIFAKRVQYRPIFQNDRVSFGEMQVLPLALDFARRPEALRGLWVFDDEFVKGLLRVQGDEIKELYVDPFFQRQGIGGRLMAFALRGLGARRLFVLEKNAGAIDFYRRQGFVFTGARRLEPGTPEYVAEMALSPQ